MLVVVFSIDTTRKCALNKSNQRKRNIIKNDKQSETNDQYLLLQKLCRWLYQIQAEIHNKKLQSE